MVFLKLPEVDDGGFIQWSASADEWRQDYLQQWTLLRAGQSHRPIHRGRRHGPGHLEGIGSGLRWSRREGLQGQTAGNLVRGVRRRKSHGEVQQLAARRQRERHPLVPCGDQEAAYDAGGGRYSFIECRTATNSRS